MRAETQRDHDPIAPALLRDAPPGTVPVPVYNEDGTLWQVLDLDARIMAAVGELARREGRSEREIVHTVLTDFVRTLPGYH